MSLLQRNLSFPSTFSIHCSGMIFHSTSFSFNELCGQGKGGESHIDSSKPPIYELLAKKVLYLSHSYHLTLDDGLRLELTFKRTMKVFEDRSHQMQGVFVV